MLSQHVKTKIDEAIEKGWIKVFYQPVIRSLTGELCGFESLARWIDPELGFLSPAQFIGTLEECELIYKLDSFMVEKVCSDMGERLKANMDIVPVSINFSRLDFQMCDMLKVVEDAVDRYDVPRDYLHIEITESIMVYDDGFMNDVIENFRRRGYEIWMDDFGSGYSSLNLLKDFRFDMLKLDMKFLSSLDVKSKAIMKSVINMAKDIGIMTLAEGVETQEDVDFLTEIGCGRLQGYFFGKPMPIEQAFENLEDKGIRTEKRNWHHFYDMAAFHIRSTDSPLEIIEDDGKEFKTLFMNDAYKMQIFDDLPDLFETDQRIYRTKTPLLQKYREYADQIERSKKPETFYYSAKGTYFCFKGREIAEQDGRHLIKGSIMNMSIDSTLEKNNDLDNKLRELNHLFGVVLLFNPSEEKVTPIIGKFRFYKGPERVNMHDSTVIMANNFIHPHDRERYMEFMNMKTFDERIRRSPFGVIENVFRFKDKDGNFRWASASIMTLPGSGGKEYLYCVKPISLDAVDTMMNHGVTENSLFNLDEYSLLWYNFVWNSTVMFFWKDTDRRFKGVSKAFIDYFRLKSEDDIIGKRGEDMEWHVNEETYVDDEEDILRSGAQKTHVISECIIGGVVHRTMSSKLPVYRNGEIVGMMGFIVDIDEERKRLGSDEGPDDTDFVTGVMNARAFLETLLDYNVLYRTSQKDYTLIVLKNIKYDRILQSYGQAFSDSVLQTIADRIIGILGTSCVVSRIRDSYFSILTYTTDRDEIIRITSDLKEKLEDIVCVESKGVTIKIAFTFHTRSDEGMTDDGIYTISMNDLEGL